MPETANSSAPQSRQTLRLDAAALLAGAAKCRRLADGIAAAESPPADWPAHTWEGIRARRQAAAEKAARRQAKAAAAARATTCGRPSCESRERVIARARAYLRRVPGAIQGRGGDNHTFRVACILILGFGLTVAEALPLILEWNPTCEPPWDEDKLERKLREADKQPGPREYLLTDLPAAAPTPTHRGYDDLTPEAAELLRRTDPDNTPPPPPPAEDPLEVAAELNKLLEPVGRCPNVRLVMTKNVETGVRGCNPAGCHRVDCPVCGRWKGQLLFQQTAPYLARLTDLNGNHGADGPRRCYAAIVPACQVDETVRAVRDAAGKYLAIPVTDATSCAETITASAPSVEIRQGEEHPTCLISTDAPNPTLVVIHLPAAATPPEGSVPVAAATAIRVTAQALLSTSRPNLVGTRRRLIRRSHGWGDKIERPVSNLKIEGKPAISLAEAKEVVQALGVQVRAVFDNNRHGEPVAWGTTPARSLLLSLLIRGAETLYKPTVDRIVDTARDWFKVLGPELGDGPRVEQVLRSRLWVGPEFGAAAELTAAHQEDVNAKRLDAECAVLVRDLGDNYRADPGPHRGFLHDMFGSGFALST
ncbi:MAG: hypothetical protein U0804_17085 [Gemmataceae bacterium]